MDNDTIQLIHELATKLGTTSEHLWGVLVKQAPVTASTNLILIAAYLTVTWLLVKLSLSRTRAIPEQESIMYCSDQRANKCTVSVGCWTAVLVMCIIDLICLDNLPTIISGFVNPEYWAFKQLVP